MKKVLFVLSVLLIATSAMAVNVDITCTPGDGGWVTIGYNVTGGPPKLRAVALEVSTNVGAIVAIRGYKTGESTSADPGYGIFPGSIDLTDPENPVWNTPIAPADDPGAAGTGLGTNKVILEMGSLYDPTIPGNAPLDTGPLCELRFSESTTGNPATITITEEKTYRGGAVMVNPNIVPVVNGGAPSVVCNPIWDYTGPDTVEWGVVGYPSYWDAPSQCYGDADAGLEQVGRNMVPVGLNDAAILLQGLRTLAAAGPPLFPIDPAVDTWIAADLNHVATLVGRNMCRVALDDAAILLTYLRTPALLVPTDCSP